jgi:methionyl-tRNA formyltransferase
MGAARETPQDDALATYAGKVTRDDARVDWNLSADEVSRTIRAYDPKPGAFTTLNGLDVKLFGTKKIVDEATSGSNPGSVISASDGIVVACGDGAIGIRDVQPSGKKRMRSTEWMRGRGISIGDQLGT